MKADEYQRLAAITAPPERDWTFAVLVSGLGLAGEAGEVADALKKAIGHEHGLDRDAIKSELGDVLWYVADLATLLGFSLNEIMTANIEKLRQRYPEGFSVERSRHRVV